MKVCVTALVIGTLLFSAGGNTSQAAIAYYPMGEAGSVAGAGNIPLDVDNGNDFLNPINGATVVAPGAGGALGSTAALEFTPFFVGEDPPVLTGDGYYFTANNFIPADNFRVEIWAKPSGTPATGALSVAVQLGVGAGSLYFGTTSPDGVATNWYATYDNVAWVGAAAGAGQTALLNTWYKLAVEVIGGNTTFYINDVAQGLPVAYTNPTVNGGASIHLGVAPGAPGVSYFNGVLDELRISAVPEPTGLTLMGLALVGMARFVRRRQS